jgi:plastocyanin
MQKKRFLALRTTGFCVMLLSLFAFVAVGSRLLTRSAMASSATTASVSIAHFSFDPARLNISVGTTVTWTNNDSVTHTVTADQGAFDSGNLSPGSTFSFTFSQAGSYPYHCTPHPSMKGTITVT